MDNLVTISVEVGFDDDGYETALCEYLRTLVGQAYSQELHDEIVERAIGLVDGFVTTSDLILTPA